MLPAQLYSPVDKASSIKVTIKNVGMAIDGTLTGLEGEIKFNPADLKNAFFSVSVDANTINTDIDIRDSALRGEAYLNAKNFPKISFLSKQITRVNKAGPYTVKGTLTIKGISKETSLNFTAVPKNDGILFTGEMRVNRHDFRIGVGSLVLSDTMLVTLVVFAKKA